MCVYDMALTYKPNATYIYRVHRSPREEYAAPLHGALFFAGEGTHTEHPACVDGAYETGARAAAEAAEAVRSGGKGKGKGNGNGNGNDGHRA